MSTDRRIAAIALALLVAALAVLPASPAFAHVALTASTPAAGATVTEPPAAVELQFDGPLLAGGDHAVGLFDPAGGRVDDDQTVEVSDRAVRTGVGGLAATGPYTVRWLVVSGDGDPIEGTYSFTYDGPVAASPAPVVPAPEPAASGDAGEAGGGSERPAEAAGSPGPGSEGAATPSPQADPSEVTAESAAARDGVNPVLPAAVGLLAVLGVAAVLLRRRSGV
jgi:hypothetical protein